MSNKTNDAIKKAKKILAKYRDEIMQKYSVKQTGVGYKIKGGRLTDKVAIIFYVDKKMNDNELAKRGVERIPKRIERIPTDVVEITGGFKPRINAKK